MADLTDIASVSSLSQFVEVVSPSAPNLDTHVRWDSAGYVSPPDQFRRLMSRRVHPVPTRVVFRGHAGCDWVLVPQIDRAEFSDYRRFHSLSRLQHERELFQDFVLAGRPHLDVPAEDEWEWLAVAQHHRLATRLLDWTANPMVALFFAVSSLPGADGAVWVYAHEGPIVDKTVSPFALETVALFHPPHMTPRIGAQCGCFTAHPAPGLFAGATWRLRVPSRAKAWIREQLLGVGISQASLFPGLDGVSQNINARLSTFRPEPSLNRHPRTVGASAPR